MLFRRTGWVAICAAMVIGAACSRQEPSRTLAIATTTSVGNSGLLDALVEPYRALGVDVRTQLVGSGLALRMLADGHVDLVISHAPAAEEAALRNHPQWDYRKIMFNDFVLLGPPHDPAAVAGSADPTDAMRRVAVSDAKFLSRGDQSGTHEREEQLWERAGVRPPAERLIVAGAGMGSTLRAASQIRAYTLSDRATFAQFSDSLELKVLFEGGPLLLNTYAVLFDPARPNAKWASAFAEFLSGAGGGATIDNYKVAGGVRGFTSWPADRPRTNPRDTPF